MWQNIKFCELYSMSHLNELTSILNQHFKWNKARMDCLVLMVLALFLQGDDKPNEVSHRF
jgi:hypothetical protein